MNNTEAFKQLFLGLAMILLALVGLTYIVPTYISIPKTLDSVYLSPALWPSIVLWIIGILGITISIKHALFLKKEKTALSGIFTEDGKKIGKNCIFCLLIFIVFFLSIEIVGLPVATSFAMFALYYLAERRIFAVGVVIMLVTPWLLYAFFTYVVDVMIPLGIFDWR